MPQHHPIATWSPERDLWEGEEDIFGHSVVFSETLPKRGMTVGGRLFELPMSAPRITGQGCSSSPHLPTPKAHDGEFGMPRTSGRPIEKSTHLQTIVAHHFPKPMSSDASGGGQHPSKRVGRTQQLVDTVLGLSGVPTPPLFDVGSD